MVALACFGCSLTIRKKQGESGSLTSEPGSSGYEIALFALAVSRRERKPSALCDPKANCREAVLRVIGSSEKVHVVDALATTGDEGRCSLR